MKKTSQQKGFTLVELMLSMVFLGSILMITTLLLVQSLSIYNKGLTTKQINQVSRTMMEELIRTSNSGTAIGFGINCLSLDGAAYIWNTADPDPVATSEYLQPPSVPFVYKYADGTLVNFIKLLDVTSGCVMDEHNIDKSKAVPLASDAVRVYTINASNVADTSRNLVRFSMTLGTYAGVGSDHNLLLDGPGSFVCRSDSLGGYCAKGSLETVLYLPNGIN